jgi:hypothetical protein
MGYQARSGASLIRIHGERSWPLLAALGYKPDEDLSREDNLIECLIDLDWECIDRSADTFGFRHDSDEAIDWQAFVNMAPFLEDGSFFEERPDDYVEDLQGNNCPGLMQALVEGGVLQCRLYALLKDSEGQKIRQLVQVLDPSLF